MIFYISLAITLVVIIFEFRSLWPGEWLGSLLLAALITVLFGMLYGGLMTAMTAIWSPDIEHISEERHVIVSLNDIQSQEDSPHGTFFLGIGSVNGRSESRLAYSWYEQTTEGALSGREIIDNAENKVLIYEDQRPGHGYVDKEWGYERTATPSWLFPWQLHEKAPYINVFRVHVPKGTVIHEFTLNGA